METIQNLYLALANNKILLITISSWIIAQSLKVVIGVIRERKFNFRWFVGTGGIVSSHAAGVSTLATAVGLRFGFDSALFAVTFIFTVIVLFDAQGVRRATGKQAEILNKMLDDMYWKKRIQEDRLKELLGHAPVEVFMGMFLGIAIALVLWRL
jgi:acid phosphatase family membrane protein YuiD